MGGSAYFRSVSVLHVPIDISILFFAYLFSKNKKCMFILYTFCIHMHFVHVLHLQLKMGDFLNPFKEEGENAVKLATFHPVWVRLLLLASCKPQTF